MDANELQRIYLLKTAGLDGVIADINAITEAFEASAKARADLAGNKDMFDTVQLATVNKQLEQMLDIQGDMLTVMKGLNPEIAKSSAAFAITAKTTDQAADGMSSLSSAAKTLGSNLSGVTPALLRVQSTLDAGKVEDYDSAINKLIADLVVMQQLKAESAAAYNSGGSTDDVDKLSRFNSRMSKLGFTIEDNQVFAGSAKIPELTEEYQNLKGSITDTTVSYAAYLKEQLEINAAIGQLTSAIKLLNNTNNPSVPIDNALAYKQQADVLLLAAKSTDAFIEKQIELGIVQADIQAKVKEGVYVGSGRQAEDEAALLQKQILFGEAWVVDLDKQNAKLEQRAAILRGNQELKGEAYAGTINADDQKKQDAIIAAQPENRAVRKVDMKDSRNEMEMLVQQNYILNEQASYYQRLSAQVNALKMSLRTLTAEELQNANAEQIMVERLEVLEAELYKFEMQMGNGQRKVGQYGLSIAGVGNVTTMFVRQLARGIGSLVIWGLLFDALTKAKDALMAAIPGTEQYIQAQEQLEQATKGVVDAFQSQTDAFEKMREAQRILYEGMHEGVSAAKAEEASIQAAGTMRGESVKADIAQRDAKRKSLEAEYQILQDKHDILQRSKQFLDANQEQSAHNLGTNWLAAKSDEERKAAAAILGYDPNKQEIKRLMEEVKKTDSIPESDKPELLDKLTKAYQNGSDVLKIYAEALFPVSTGLKKVNEEQRVALSSKRDLDIALNTKNINLVYDKNRELTAQLLQLDITYRELKEHGAIETVDKIVNDTAAKYKLMYYNIDKAKQDYIKQYSGDITDKDYLKSLAKFSEEHRDIVRDEKQDKKNQLDDNRRRANLSNSQFESNAATTNAGISTFNADYGLANYGRMAAAQDEDAAAKKLAAQNEAIQKKAQVLSESQGTAFANDKIAAQMFLSTRELEIENEKNDKIQQIEKEAYKKRLQLGVDYFKKLQDVSDAQLTNLLQAQDNYTLERINDVLAGRGSQEAKDKKVDRITNRGIIYNADNTISSSKQLMPEAVASTKKASDNWDSAKHEVEDAKFAQNKDDIATATDKATEAQFAYNKALADQLLLEGKIDKATHDKLVAAQQLKKKEISTKDVANAMLSVAQTFSDGLFDLMAKQDAYKEEMAQRSLTWNQQIMSSETQSNNQRLAEAKAMTIAENTLHKQQAEDAKKRAEQQIIVNAVIGASKALADGEPPMSILDAGVVLAQAAIQEAFLAKAPAYASGIYGNSSHPGGLAWVGDGGEHEVILSPNTSTLMNLPQGSQVIPMSHIGLGSDLKAPRFTSTSSFGNNGSSSNGVDVQAHEEAIHNIYDMIGQMARHVSNIQVNYDAKAAQRAGLKASFTKRTI